jgi:copper(I)-binding protein
MRNLLYLLLAAALPAAAQINIENPWTRATPPGAKVAGGYMTVVNRGAAPDKLVGASSSAAARVETHVHIMEGNVMKMRAVPGYEIPANGRFELKPGGAHLMFMDIKGPFKQGEKVPVKLRFERAGELEVELAVGAVGASAPAMMEHGMKR